ncbi:hypothetical protein K435DRAFT_864258 [Dendrothele bispora CBS 962.96]|uniref:Uncharacterized protein n=1 Tax=Dendrothele bispora (strain CBS 962.96) TaxID=1314807 RepID=A0A4S8LNV3_DENBC|nr:hypothetical protein K435DRAFT_864258 [Dendrothele bispora CBS 962.96]
MRTLLSLENGFREDERMERTNVTKCRKCGQMKPEALYPVLIIVIGAAENARPAIAEEMLSSQSIGSPSGQASGSEGYRPMTESQSNAPATITLEAEHTEGNST